MRTRFRPPRRPNKVNAFLTDELFAELERHAEANGETPGAFASRVLANHLRSTQRAMVETTTEPGLPAAAGSAEHVA